MLQSCFSPAIVLSMPKKVNDKCVLCSKTPRDIFVRNRPDCYDYKNCRRKRAYYRNHEENKLKEHRWHRYLKFRTTLCFVCGSTEDLQCHHVISQVRRGKDDSGNVVTLCGRCHLIISNFEKKLGQYSKRKPRWVISAEKFPPSPGPIHVQNRQ